MPLTVVFSRPQKWVLAKTLLVEHYYHRQGKFRQKTQEIISVHDVREPLKQVLLASRDVIISGQSCVSKFQRFCTLGDGWWLPI